MAKLVNAADSKSVTLRGLSVRLRPEAPFNMYYITSMPLFSINDKVRLKTDSNKKGLIVKIEPITDTFRYVIIYNQKPFKIKGHEHTIYSCFSALEESIELDFNYEN